MAVMTIGAKSPVFQLVIKLISSLDNGSPNVPVFTYWMCLKFVNTLTVLEGDISWRDECKTIAFWCKLF